MSMPKLNAPAEIHWRRSNMNTRDPILMKSVEVLKDCRSLNAAAEMNCPMPRSVEKVPIRNEKRCKYIPIYMFRKMINALAVMYIFFLKNSNNKTNYFIAIALQHRRLPCY